MLPHRFGISSLAYIPVSGAITRKAVFSWWSGRSVSAGQDAVLEALESALEDRSVKSILLDIDSPGGVVAGTKELADRVAFAAKIKPMAAYANGLMCSSAFRALGLYWYAAPVGAAFLVGRVPTPTPAPNHTGSNGIGSCPLKGRGALTSTSPIGRFTTRPLSSTRRLNNRWQKFCSANCPNFPP